MIPTSATVSIQVKNDVPRDAEAIAILIQEGAPPAHDALPGPTSDAIKSLLKAQVVRGKANELTLQLLEGANRKPQQLIVVGLGKSKNLSAESFREAGATLAKAARKHRIGSIAIHLPETPKTLPGMPGTVAAGPGAEVAAAALVTGLSLGSFHYDEYKGAAKKKAEASDKKPRDLSCTLLSTNPSIRAAVDRARILSEGQNFARTIASRPGNNINPPSLAKVAQQLAKEVGLSAQVFDEKQIAKLGMGGLQAVGAGSATPPRLIVLEHKGKSKSKPLLVVGKAITFDTGGISIKPADKMGEMIYDKCGGMAVLGLMYVVAKLNLPIHIVGILSSAENHVSSTAYRPGDILTFYNGVTAEITNTDAEGRLVLFDALAYGIEKYKPSAVVDLATLTGGCIVALGETMAGLMSNDDALVADLQSAADRASEKIWRLPIGDDQRNQIKSHHADIVNSAGRYASPLQGAAFLSYAIPDAPKTPWAHFDIAGVADTEKELPLYTRGATGWGVRTLFEWVLAKMHAAK